MEEDACGCSSEIKVGNDSRSNEIDHVTMS